MLLVSRGEFGDAVASALWGQLEGSLLQALDLCREDSKEGTSGSTTSTASLSSDYPINPIKPVLSEF